MANPRKTCDTVQLANNRYLTIDSNEQSTATHPSARPPSCPCSVHLGQRNRLLSMHATASLLVGKLSTSGRQNTLAGALK